MFVLHWICALTLTLVCSFTCQPLRENTDVFELESLIKDFNETIENSRCLMDGTYYSPTDVKEEECVVSALNCTLQELRVIGSECDMTDNQEFKTLVVTINNTVNDYKNDTLCQKFFCETASHKFPEFMKNIKNLVQRLNSQ